MAPAPTELNEAIREGRCLIVCGAGVSRLATGGQAPGWKRLIEMGLAAAKSKADDEWIQLCGNLVAARDANLWLTAAGLIQDKLGKEAGKPYRAFLKAAVGELKATQFDIIEALRALAAARNPIATTNYDSVLCDGIGCRVVAWTNAEGAAECLSGDRKAILHLHGHWDEPPSVVFSATDYSRVRGDGSAQFLQQLAAHTRTLVFVGCSNAGLADENVGQLLQWFGQHWTGLGRKHYVLVREAELTAGWPEAVTPVAYGKDYDELPAFLKALAPARAAERAPFPPDPKMIGRRAQLEEVLTHILTGDRPVIVPGGPGMGKTTLALAAAHDERARTAFGSARVFVDLQAVTSAEAMLRALAAELDVEISDSAAYMLTCLAAQAAQAPALAILDNLETPWYAEPTRTEALLGQLASVGGLRLVITVRGETPYVAGGARKLRDIEQLAPDEARALFLRHVDQEFATDPALPVLLDALDGHPLSIVLMAAQTDGRRNLAGLVAAWDKERAAVLARGAAKGRLTSVRVSLGLSLERLKDRPDAKRLLGLVALLPAGLQEEDIAGLLPDADADAGRMLEKARLVDNRDGRLAMLAPLREAAREGRLATPEDEARLVEHFLAVATEGNKIGKDAWPTVREQVTREAANLDAICLLAVERAGADAHADLEPLKAALRGLAELYRYGMPAEVRSLHRALALGDSGATLPLKAECAIRLAAIAIRRSDYDTARARFEEAKGLYERVGSLLGQANCIKGLGDIALARSDHDTARARFEEAKPLYERAGSLLGQANSIKALGEIAFARADHDTARARYEAAKALYERVDSLLGQANCINGLGDIALARSDHDAARVRYDEAKPLYERVGAVLGQANCIQSLGDIALDRADRDTARDRFEEALALYAKIPEPCSMGFAQLRLMKVAASAADGTRRREAARASWASIGRQDLITEYLSPK